MTRTRMISLSLLGFLGLLTTAVIAAYGVVLTYAPGQVEITAQNPRLEKTKEVVALINSLEATRGRAENSCQLEWRLKQWRKVKSFEDSAPDQAQMLFNKRGKAAKVVPVLEKELSRRKDWEIGLCTALFLIEK